MSSPSDTFEGPRDEGAGEGGAAGAGAGAAAAVSSIFVNVVYGGSPLPCREFRFIRQAPASGGRSLDGYWQYILFKDGQAVLNVFRDEKEELVAKGYATEAKGGPPDDKCVTFGLHGGNHPSTTHDARPEKALPSVLPVLPAKRPSSLRSSPPAGASPSSSPPAGASSPPASGSSVFAQTAKPLDCNLAVELDREQKRALAAQLSAQKVEQFRAKKEKQQAEKEAAKKAEREKQQAEREKQKAEREAAKKATKGGAAYAGQLIEKWQRLKGAKREAFELEVLREAQRLRRYCRDLEAQYDLLSGISAAILSFGQAIVPSVASASSSGLAAIVPSVASSSGLAAIVPSSASASSLSLFARIVEPFRQFPGKIGDTVSSLAAVPSTSVAIEGLLYAIGGSVPTSDMQLDGASGSTGTSAASGSSGDSAASGRSQPIKRRRIDARSSDDDDDAHSSDDDDDALPPADDGKTRQEEWLPLWAAEQRGPLLATSTGELRFLGDLKRKKILLILETLNPTAAIDEIGFIEHPDPASPHFGKLVVGENTHKCLPVLGRFLLALPTAPVFNDAMRAALRWVGCVIVEEDLLRAAVTRVLLNKAANPSNRDLLLAGVDLLSLQAAIVYFGAGFHGADWWGFASQASLTGSLSAPMMGFSFSLHYPGASEGICFGPILAALAGFIVPMHPILDYYELRRRQGDDYRGLFYDIGGNLSSGRYGYGEEADAGGEEDDAGGEEDDAGGEEDDAGGEEDDAGGEEDDAGGEEDDAGGEEDDAGGEEDDAGGEEGL